MSGKLIVISGPSGSGKSSVLKRVFAKSKAPLEFSVSATTRHPRPGEIDGRDYHFLSNEEFAKRRERGDFLECFELFAGDGQPGRWYGTLRDHVTSGLEAGKWVVLEIDVNGTQAVLDQFPETVTIFVRPSSFADLEQRLRKRGTETGGSLTRRLAVAEQELKTGGQYQYQIVNDDLDEAVRSMCKILSQLEGETL